jgi:hypothetical protein
VGIGIRIGRTTAPDYRVPPDHPPVASRRQKERPLLIAVSELCQRHARVLSKALRSRCPHCQNKGNNHVQIATAAALAVPVLVGAAGTAQASTLSASGHATALTDLRC